MTRSSPPSAFRRTSDGCTGVPDRIHGIPVGDLCEEHDWDYHALRHGRILTAPVRPEPTHGIAWTGPGCYVPVMRDPEETVLPEVTWIRYGSRPRSRAHSDSRFASDTWGRLKAERKSARGLWGRLMASTPPTWWLWSLIRAVARLLGVRWLGKWRGRLRWVVVALTAVGLGALALWLIRKLI